MHGNFKVWRLFVVALEIEAKSIIDYYKLLQVTNRTISNFPDLSRKMFGDHFHQITDKFSIYMNGLEKNGVIVIVCGVGKVNAAAATSYGITIFHPGQVINIGMCGALKGKLFQRGDVVSVQRVFQHDAYIPIKGVEFDYLMESIQIGNLNIIPAILTDIEKLCHYNKVILATGDSFIDDEMSRFDLQQIADIVDMEGYAVARICSMFGVELEMYKIVSDLADEKAEFDFKDSLEIYNESISKFLNTF